MPTDKEYEIFTALGGTRTTLDRLVAERDTPQRTNKPVITQAPMPLNQDEVSFDQAEKKQYDPIEEDVYQAELVDVTSREEPKYKDPNTIEKKINFEFAIIEDGPFYGRRTWRSVTPKCSAGGGEYSPSNLYVILCALTGKNLTEEECAKVDTAFVNSCIGSQVKLAIKQKTSATGKVYNAISEYMRVKKRLPPFDQAKSTAMAEAAKTSAVGGVSTEDAFA